MSRLPVNRREFIALAALAAAGCRLPGSSGPRLACQMWSVRDLWQKGGDVTSLFPKIASIGYEGVQSMAFWSCDQSRLADSLAASELALADMPLTFDRLVPDKLESTVAFCRRFDVTFVYIPWQKNGGRSDWEQFRDRLLEASETLRPHSIRIGYHNHLQEFQPFPTGEKGCPIDVLASAPGVDLELDVGPVAESGRDAVACLRGLAGRVPGMHAKPYGASAIGAKGDVQDWPALVSAAKTGGTKWLVVECELRQATFDDIAASHACLKRLV